MNKKNKKLELKIYEALGIKQFRNILFKVVETVNWQIRKRQGISKEKYYRMSRSASNYHMDKGHGLQDLKDFKKQLYLNSGLHIFAIIPCIRYIFMVVGGMWPLSIITLMSGITCIIINTYCIMLQRYNYARIDEVIKKRQPHEDMKKNKLKEELVKEESLLSEHTYKFINEACEEKDITFDQLLETSTYAELKKWRHYLYSFKERIEMQEKQQQRFGNDNLQTMNVPLKENKILRLELKPKNLN